MKAIVATIFLGTLANGVCNISMAEEKFASIALDVQIVSKELHKRLVEKGSEFGDSLWPANLAATQVKREDIPAEVFAKTAGWLRTMIKANWLPEDPETWMMGVRKEVPRKADYLVLRYKVGGQIVQIQEDGANVCMLIDTGSLGEMQPEAFLTSIVRKFLMYPDDKLSSLQFHLERFEHEGRTVSCGTMDCDFDRNDTEAYLKRTWYNHTYVWTDGRRAYFGLVEMDGKPPERKHARPGIPTRFKPAK